MKKLTLLFVLLTVGSAAFSQGVKVGSTPGNPDASSIFELESTDQGFLPPRMSSAQRDAIVSPADGLVIFNTTTNCLNYMVAGFWQEVCGVCIPQPTTANAGFDEFNLGNTHVTLAGNTPVLGTGSWTIVHGNGGVLGSASDPSSDFTGIPGLNYVLRWTISNECGISEDDVNITFANPAPGSFTYYYTGDSQTFIVPLGVTSIQIEVWGAQGATAGEITGGLGGYAKGNLAVSSGQSLILNVGGEGYLNAVGGFNGGGTGGMSAGGGASDVRTGPNLSDRVIVAGGGGGSTYYDSFGGNGGGTNGGEAMISTIYECAGPESVVYGIGGGGGTQTEGGTAGSYYAPNNGGAEGVAGTLGIGGGTDNWNNGGGGGGYYGGGSGGTPGCSGWGAGGGGGSSYIGGVTDGITIPGVRTGNGLITVTW